MILSRAVRFFLFGWEHGPVKFSGTSAGLAATIIRLAKLSSYAFSSALSWSGLIGRASVAIHFLDRSQMFPEITHSKSLHSRTVWVVTSQGPNANFSVRI